MLVFDVFALDMLPDGNGGWEENARYRVGEISVEAENIDAVTDKMLLDALYRLKLRNFAGLSYPAISTTDRRVVYAEDFYGDGAWWEVGSKKGHEPCYGLRRKEN